MAFGGNSVRNTAAGLTMRLLLHEVQGSSRTDGALPRCGMRTRGAPLHAASFTRTTLSAVLLRNITTGVIYRVALGMLGEHL